MQIEIHKPVTVSTLDDQWVEILDTKGETVALRMVDDIEYVDEEIAIAQYIADAINAYKG